MFCLKCGKKLPQNATGCPFCQCMSGAAHADNYTQQLGELGLFPEDKRFQGIQILKPEPEPDPQERKPEHPVPPVSPNPDNSTKEDVPPYTPPKPPKKKWRLIAGIVAVLCCVSVGAGVMIAKRGNGEESSSDLQAGPHVATEATSIESSGKTSKESSLESEESSNTANTEDSAADEPPGETIVVEDAINTYLETDTSEDGTSSKMATIIEDCFRHEDTIEPENISVVDEGSNLPASDDTYILIDYRNEYSSSGTIPIEEINSISTNVTTLALDGKLTLKPDYPDYNLTYHKDGNTDGKYFALSSDDGEQAGGVYLEELKSGGSLVLIYLNGDDGSQGTYRLYYATKDKEKTASLHEIDSITILSNKSTTDSTSETTEITTEPTIETTTTASTTTEPDESLTESAEDSTTETATNSTAE